MNQNNASKMIGLSKSLLCQLYQTVFLQFLLYVLNWMQFGNFGSNWLVDYSSEFHHGIH